MSAEHAGQDHERRAEIYARDVAPVWDLHAARALLPRLEELVERDTALVAECRTGTLVRALRRRMPEFARIMAVDPRRERLDIVRRVVSDEAGPAVYFSVQHSARLNFASDVFGLSVCTNGLAERHVASRIIRECARVVRPGGWLALAVVGSGSFPEIDDVLQEAVWSIGTEADARSLERCRAQRLDESALRELCHDAGIAPVDGAMARLPIRFASARAALFSALVRATFLTGWLKVGATEASRAKLLHEALRRLSVYAEDRPVDSVIELCWLIGRSEAHGSPSP